MDSKVHEQPGVLAGRTVASTASREVAVLMEHQLRTSARTNILSIARQLGASTRTMQRRLAEESTTFQQVLEDTRRRLAVELLAEPSPQAIKEIAALLGFVAVRSFERAFQRWTGQTPGAWRNQNRLLDTRS
jgi:AraC-like DNA-binding protein